MCPPPRPPPPLQQFQLQTSVPQPITSFLDHALSAHPLLRDPWGLSPFTVNLACAVPPPRPERRGSALHT